MKNLNLKRIFILSFSLPFLLSNCTNSEDPVQTKTAPIPSLNNTEESDGIDYSIVEFPIIEGDQLDIDSLFVQVGYQLNEERWILIGRSMKDDPKGLKMLLINPKENFKLLYQSRGAYESMTLHPQFFKPVNPNDPWVILCALGQNESWGQELFFMKGDSIQEASYLDVALKEEADSSFYEKGYVLKDISPYTRITKNGNEFRFSFEADSLLYFGDIENKIDPVLDGHQLAFIYNHANGELILTITD